jgi:hypothetical protein
MLILLFPHSLLQFYSLWQAGNDARLNLECHAGKAQIHLQLHLHLQPQPHHHPPPPPQQPRLHLGPSQLRRRARRELARATAAEAANPAAENADDDAAPAPPCHQDVPAHLAPAGQANQVTAEQADDGPPPPRPCTPSSSHSCASWAPAR